jgi:hypothetical protein
MDWTWYLDLSVCRRLDMLPVASNISLLLGRSVAAKSRLHSPRSDVSTRWLARIIARGRESDKRFERGGRMPNLLADREACVRSMR